MWNEKAYTALILVQSKICKQLASLYYLFPYFTYRNNTKQAVWYIPAVCNPDLWPFDLETGLPVAPKVGNFPSKRGHAMPLGSRIIRHVRDGRTDRRTDKNNAHCPFPTVGGIISKLNTDQTFHTGDDGASIYPLMPPTIAA